MSESKTTTVVIPKTLKNDLDTMKVFDRETYADVIGRLIHIVKEDEEAHLHVNAETLKKIEQGRKDLREGKGYTTSELKKKLGI